MRKFDPLHEPTADKSALKCFDYAYLTEMTRLGTQSVVRVEEISKKELRNNTFKLLKGSPSGKMTDCLLLYIVLLKRGLIVLRPGPHECDILNLGIVFFFFCLFFRLFVLFCFVFTQIRADGAFKSCLESGFKTMRFRWVESSSISISSGKKKHLRLQKYPDWCEPGLRHTVETVDCQQSLGIIARVCMLNAREQGKRAREKTEREDGSLYFFCLCTSSLLDWLLFRVLLSLNPTDTTCTACSLGTRLP